MVTSETDSFLRLNKTCAKREFENGGKLYVMSIERNPISSPGTAYIYYKGCKPLWGDSGWTEINTFEEMLADFSEWLYNDGYGHMAQRYDADNYRFSYWVNVDNIIK